MEPTKEKKLQAIYNYKLVQCFDIIREASYETVQQRCKTWHLWAVWNMTIGVALVKFGRFLGTYWMVASVETPP